MPPELFSALLSALPALFAIGAGIVSRNYRAAAQMGALWGLFVGCARSQGLLPHAESEFSKRLFPGDPIRAADTSTQVARFVGVLFGILMLALIAHALKRGALWCCGAVRTALASKLPTQPEKVTGKRSKFTVKPVYPAMALAGAFIWLTTPTTTDRWVSADGSVACEDIEDTKDIAQARSLSYRDFLTTEAVDGKKCVLLNANDRVRLLEVDDGGAAGKMVIERDGRALWMSLSKLKLESGAWIDPPWGWVRGMTWVTAARENIAAAYREWTAVHCADGTTQTGDDATLCPSVQDVAAKEEEGRAWFRNFPPPPGPGAFELHSPDTATKGNDTDRAMGENPAQTPAEDQKDQELLNVLAHQGDSPSEGSATTTADVPDRTLQNGAADDSHPTKQPEPVNTTPSPNALDEKQLGEDVFVYIGLVKGCQPPRAIPQRDLERLIQIFQARPTSPFRAGAWKAPDVLEELIGAKKDCDGDLERQLVTRERRIASAQPAALALMYHYAPGGCDYAVNFPAEPSRKMIEAPSTPIGRYEQAELLFGSNVFRVECVTAPLDQAGAENMLRAQAAFDALQAPTLKQVSGTVTELQGYKILAGQSARYSLRIYRGGKSILTALVASKSEDHPMALRLFDEVSEAGVSSPP